MARRPTLATRVRRSKKGHANVHRNSLKNLGPHLNPAKPGDIRNPRGINQWSVLREAVNATSAEDRATAWKNLIERAKTDTTAFSVAYRVTKEMSAADPHRGEAATVFPTHDDAQAQMVERANQKHIENLTAEVEFYKKAFKQLENYLLKDLPSQEPVQ